MTDMRPEAPQVPTPEKLVGGGGARLKAAIVGVVVVGVMVVGLVSAGAFGGGDAGASPGRSTGADGAEGSGSGSPEGSASGSADGSADGSPGGSVSPTASPIPYIAVAPTSRGLIAVVSDDGRLSTMDDGGGSRAEFLMPGVVLGFPAWSPDGSRIAVTGQSADGTAIYVFAVGRRYQPTMIYRSADRPPFYLYWTPDGQSVSFLANEGGSIALRVAPADGSAPLDGSGDGSIVRIGAPLYFDWVNDKRLLLHVGLGSDAFAGEVGPDGAPIQQALPGTGVFRSPSASADGRYLAYVRSKTDLSGTLVVAARDGSTSRELAVFGPTAFMFEPKGHLLATIASARPGDTATGIPAGPLTLIDAGSGKTRTLIDSLVVAAFWSPDGRTIAALLPPRPGDDNVTTDVALRGVPGVGIDSGSHRGVILAAALTLPSTDGPATAQAPGTTVRLAFVDVATGKIRSERVVHLAGHFVNELLPYFDQYALSHSLWSPDSASLLLPLVDATGRDQLVVIPSDGSASRPIADGDSGFWSK
jgi:TolB protein